jgi:hypothetical protein
MDTTHAALVPEFPVSLTVLATVVSRHGERVVLDCGLKTVGAHPGEPRLKDVEARFARLSEEHLLYQLRVEKGRYGMLRHDSSRPPPTPSHP